MRRFFFIFLILLSLCGIGVPLWWYVSADLLSRSIAGWAEKMRAAGYHVAYRNFEVDGFPFYLRGVIGDFTLSGPKREDATLPSAWSLRGSEAVFRLRPWSLKRIEFFLPGTYEATYAGGSGQRSVFAFAEDAHGYLSLDGAGLLEAGYLDLSSVELIGEEGEQALPGSFEFYAEGARMGRAALNIRRATDQSGPPGLAGLDLVFRLEDVVLPVEDGLFLGPAFSRLQGEIRSAIAFPSGPLADSARSWRDEGGTLEISNLIVHWGPLAVEGEGTLALDKALQPMGAMSARIRGFEETLDLLAGRGIMAPGEAATAKIILGLLARRPEEGAAPVLKTPLSLQDLWLSAGPVRVLKLRPLSWN